MFPEQSLCRLHIVSYDRIQNLAVKAMNLEQQVRIMTFPANGKDLYQQPRVLNDLKDSSIVRQAQQQCMVPKIRAHEPLHLFLIQSRSLRRGQFVIKIPNLIDEAVQALPV